MPQAGHGTSPARYAGQDALAISQQVGDARDEELLRNAKASPGRHILEAVSSFWVLGQALGPPDVHDSFFLGCAAALRTQAGVGVQTDRLEEEMSEADGKRSPGPPSLSVTLSIDEILRPSCV